MAMYPHLPGNLFLVWLSDLSHSPRSSLLLTRQRRSWVVSMSVPSVLQDVKHGLHKAGACPRASCPRTNVESPRSGEVTMYGVEDASLMK